MTSETNYLLEQVQNAMDAIGAIREESNSDVNAQLQQAHEVIDAIDASGYISALIELGYDEMRALIWLEAMFYGPNSDEMILMAIWWQFKNALQIANSQ